MKQHQNVMGSSLGLVPPPSFIKRGLQQHLQSNQPTKGCRQKRNLALAEVRTVTESLPPRGICVKNSINAETKQRGFHLFFSKCAGLLCRHNTELCGWRLSAGDPFSHRPPLQAEPTSSHTPKPQ